MRVAANHFVVDLADDRGDIEAAFFVGDLRVEEDLEEKVAEFFGEFGVVGGVESIEDLVGFFDEVSAEGRVGLFTVPRAAVRGAKPGHDGDQFLELGANVAWREFAVGGAAGARGAFGFAWDHW